MSAFAGGMGGKSPAPWKLNPYRAPKPQPDRLVVSEVESAIGWQALDTFFGQFGQVPK